MGYATGWTMVKFNDPLGTTGVRKADTNGNSDSHQALYADFQTLSPVMESRWDSTKFSAAMRVASGKFASSHI